MKTEKKSSEPSCVPPVVVKEESEAADSRVKIKEESGQGNNEEGAPGEDAADCLKETALEAPSVENALGGGSIDTQNGAGGQGILNSVKTESDTISSVVEELAAPDCGTNVILPADVMQPLSSNVLSKQMGSGTNTGEAQYMQQQSQIFVFSTLMANKGAEMVISNQYSTIIAFHMAQPSTKKFLEKHPNKMPHFRPNPAQWLSNFTGMKQKNHQSPNMGFPGEQLSDLPQLDPNESAFWNDQPNMRNLNGSNPMGNPESSIDDPNLNVPCLVPNSPSNTVNPQSVGSSMIGQSPNLMGGTTSPGPGSVQPSLQGKKVPNENITPQQRQHREEKLALLSKMRQQFLMQDHPHPDLAAAQMDPTHPGNPSGPHCPTGLPPVNNQNQCNPGTMDWQKLQHPFMDGKNKVGVGSPGMPVRQCGTTGGGMIPNASGAGNVGPVPGPLGGATPGVTPVTGGRPGTQGPPPPYHQTTRSASVPIAIQSPNPASPSNQTSNLSLPSPRASSALNSPADCNRQFQLTNPNAPGGGATGQRTASHLPGQSPTSQDSPNASAVGNSGASRLNCSNPGTPVSHGHLTALSPSGTPQKDPSSLDFPGNPSANVDNMFCRMQSLTQQKQQMGTGGPVKELMPVPSPQQLPYLNSFDGQELTIQKQPNTSIKEPGNTQTNPEMGNRMLPSNIETGNSTAGTNQFGQRSEVSSPSIDNANRGFGGSLHSPHTPHTPHTPGNVTPHTPVDSGKSGNKTQSAQSSPASHNTSLTEMGMGPPRTIPASPNTKSETSPSSKDLQQQQNLSGVPGQGNNQGNIPGGMIPSLNTGVNAPFGCGRPTTNVSQPNDNIPLNPNNIGNRMGGLGPMSNNSFDPISSLAQMSQQLTNTAASNVLGNDNSPMHPGNTQGMMPFNHGNMHMMQMQQQQQQQGLNEMNGSCHMGPGGPPGPPNEPGNVSGLCIGLGGPATSYSPTPHTGSPGLPNKMGHSMMSHGIMTSGGPQAPGNPNVNVSQPGAYPSGPGPGPGPGPGMMGPGPGPEGPQNRLGMPGQLPHQAPPPHHQQHVHAPGPYNGANVQVKPSAPNTIQYLPARPANVGHAPRGPPSLDFLQRFTNPMQGIDNNKMNSPSVNLQYFPNGCNNLGPGPGSGPPGGPGPQGPPHGNMGGPGPGPGNMPPNMGGSIQSGMGGPPQGHMHPSMRPGPGAAGSQGLGMRQQSNIIRMQHMAGGGMFPSSPMDPDKVFPPDMGPGPPMPGQGSPGMYGIPPLGPGQKQPNPMGQLGPPPDATQPLPPSMGTGGTGANFKNSPFMSGGPSMSDPNYAQQYHHFQQQLYATGTRGNNGPQAHPGMHNQPSSHQQFFMPK